MAHAAPRRAASSRRGRRTHRAVRRTVCDAPALARAPATATAAAATATAAAAAAAAAERTRRWGARRCRGRAVSSLPPPPSKRSRAHELATPAATATCAAADGATARRDRRGGRGAGVERRDGAALPLLCRAAAGVPIYATAARSAPPADARVGDLVRGGAEGRTAMRPPAPRGCVGGRSGARRRGGPLPPGMAHGGEGTWHRRMHRGAPTVLARQCVPCAARR